MASAKRCAMLRLTACFEKRRENLRRLPSDLPAEFAAHRFEAPGDLSGQFRLVSALQSGNLVLVAGGELAEALFMFGARGLLGRLAAPPRMPPRRSASTSIAGASSAGERHGIAAPAAGRRFAPRRRLRSP